MSWDFCWFVISTVFGPISYGHETGVSRNTRNVRYLTESKLCEISHGIQVIPGISRNPSNMWYLTESMYNNIYHKILVIWDILQYLSNMICLQYFNICLLTDLLSYSLRNRGWGRNGNLKISLCAIMKKSVFLITFKISVMSN